MATAKPPLGGDEFLRVEERGLEPVPDELRRGHPRELFWIWAGALADFFSFIAGALLVNPIGLGVSDALLVLVAGAVAGAGLLGAMSVTGARSGVPQIVYSRLAFGTRGAAIGGALTMVIAVGWFSYDCAIAVTTAKALPVFGSGPPAVVVAAMLLVMVIACIAVAVFGHRTITLVQAVQAPTFLALCALIALFLLPRFHPGLQSQLVGWPHVAAMLLGFTSTFALVVSWVSYAGDYSRYLPRRSSSRSITLYSGLGTVTSLVICGALGIMVQSIDPKSLDIASLIVRNVPTWLSWVFVVFIVVAEMSSNYLNIYTAGLSALAIGLPARRWVAALVVGLLGGAFAGYVLMQPSLQVSYVGFLTATYVWFPAWCVVVLVDAWRRRGTGGGWSGIGRLPRVSWPAVITLVLGTAVTLSLYQEPGFFQGPAARLLFHDQPADISSFVGVAFSLLLFALVVPRGARAARPR